jgi:hypothetical protein
MDTIAQHIFCLSLRRGKLIKSRREIAQGRSCRRGDLSNDAHVVLMERYNIS